MFRVFGAPKALHVMQFGPLDTVREPPATIPAMLDLTSAHNWVAFAAMLLIVAFLLRQLGKHVAPVNSVVSAALGG